MAEFGVLFLKLIIFPEFMRLQTISCEYRVAVVEQSSDFYLGEGTYTRYLGGHSGTFIKSTNIRLYANDIVEMNGRFGLVVEMNGRFGLVVEMNGRFGLVVCVFSVRGLLGLQ